jgi:mono/diheme cytochrome c family protein
MKPTLILSLLILCSAPAAHASSGMGNSERGKTIFSQRCTMCHGEDGRGRDGMAADLVGEWQRLTKPDLELKRNLQSGLRTPGKIYSAGQCPPHVLSERDMDDVLNFLRSAFGTSQPDFGR